MLLRLDAADRLVREIEERGPLPAEEAARVLLAAVSGPAALADRVLDGVVRGDARLARSGGDVLLAASPYAEIEVAEARFAVLDVETTGFSPETSRISELACVLLERGEVVAELDAPEGDPAALVAFARGCVLAGHNVRFDLAFLGQELSRAHGSRPAAPVVDTLALARRLLRGRIERATLAALAEFFGVSERPCHRALPDARATAQVLLSLLGLACEQGARTVADLCGLARPRSDRRTIA